MALKYFATHLSFMLKKIKNNNLDVHLSRRYFIFTLRLTNRYIQLKLEMKFWSFFLKNETRSRRNLGIRLIHSVK